MSRGECGDRDTVEMTRPSRPVINTVTTPNGAPKRSAVCPGGRGECLDGPDPPGDQMHWLAPRTTRAHLPVLEGGRAELEARQDGGGQLLFGGK